MPATPVALAMRWHAWDAVQCAILLALVISQLVTVVIYARLEATSLGGRHEWTESWAIPDHPIAGMPRAGPWPWSHLQLFNPSSFLSP